MRNVVLGLLAFTLLSQEALAESRGQLEPSNFPFMVRGYCYAGTKIKDEAALGGFGSSDNLPKSIDKTVKSPRRELYLLALPESETVFGGKYKGLSLLLVNGTKYQQSLEASDSRISILQEAKDIDGRWKPIEYLPSSWCGNSYHTVFLGPKEYWSFSAPKYEGTFNTTLRFTLNRGGKGKFYSNEFSGSINPEQFTVKEGHTPTGLMDPYNE